MSLAARLPERHVLIAGMLTAGETLGAISRALGVSRERVRQIEASDDALWAIRHPGTARPRPPQKPPKPPEPARRSPRLERYAERIAAGDTLGEAAEACGVGQASVQAATKRHAWLRAIYDGAADARAERRRERRHEARRLEWAQRPVAAPAPPAPPAPPAKQKPMTLAARLRAHDPAAIREVYEAVHASRGVLAEVGRLLGCRGNVTAAAGRLVALAGLEEQLAAAQQEHGTGGSGRRPRVRVRVLVQITGAPLDVLTKRARAACVDDRGPGPAWAMAELVMDETGAVRGRLVKEG